MNRKALAVTGAVAALAVAFVADVLREPGNPREFFTGDRPVTAAQIRERLGAAGYDGIAVNPVRQYFDVTATKGDRKDRFVFEAQTGRRAAEVWIDDPD
jgi:hypothetical protein